VIISTQETRAIARRGAILEGSLIDVKAKDDYQLVGAAATAAISGTVGVGVTAIVSVLNNTTSAVWASWTTRRTPPSRTRV
jgi:hypothetical protein